MKIPKKKRTLFQKFELFCMFGFLGFIYYYIYKGANNDEDDNNNSSKNTDGYACLNDNDEQI